MFTLCVLPDCKPEVPQVTWADLAEQAHMTQFRLPANTDPCPGLLGVTDTKWKSGTARNSNHKQHLNNKSYLMSKFVISII